MDDGPVFCEHCGSVSEKLEGLLANKERALHDLEKDLRNWRAKVGRLQRERALDPKQSPLYSYARQAFDYWRSSLCPRARELNGKRLDAVIARLAGTDTPDVGLALIKRGVDGARRLPYVTNQGRTATGRPSERQVELELICRSEANLMRFASYAQDQGPVSEREARENLLLAPESSRVDTMENARLAELIGTEQIEQLLELALIECDLGLDDDARRRLVQTTLRVAAEKILDGER